MLSGGEVPRILLRGILESLDLLVTKDGVVIEVEFGIEGDYIPALGDGERVDLHLGAVLFDKKAIGGVKKTTGSAKSGRGEAEEDTDLTGLIGLETEAGMDGFPKDGLGIFFCDRLDIDPTLLAGDNHRTAGGTVQNNGEVKFPGDLGRFADQDGVDWFSFWAGLMRDEGVTDHNGSDVFDLPRGFNEMNTSLVTIRKMALPSPAGMDLGLDNEAVARKPAGDGFGLFRGTGDGSTGNGDPRGCEEFACLIFVDVHKSFVVKG